MTAPDVPVMLSALTEYGCEEYLKRLRAVGCARVWIAVGTDMLFSDVSDELSRAVRFFKDAGLETGVWINGFGYGGGERSGKPWQRTVSVTGKEAAGDVFCPEDGGFTAAYCDQLVRIAKTAPDLIMLDDDLCLSVRPGIGCFCPKHRALIEKRLGEPLPKERLFEMIFGGAPNRYRDAWYAVTGDSMREFCRRAREAVDGVDKSIRLGFCAGYTHWTFEGADPVELSKILAGGTAPFFRLTAAPYWASRHVSRFPSITLAAVIENARMQAAWCEDERIEFFAEDDSYPRPAYHVPASYIESFDTALCACGVRSLKYMFDYVSPPGYEEAYERLHIKNAEFREKVRAAFAGKAMKGVRIITPRRDVTAMTLPEAPTLEKSVMREYFSAAAEFLANLGVPTRYGGDRRVCAAFGGDADAIESLDGIEKLILDLPAALRLQERGIYCGVKSVKPAGKPAYEQFGKTKILLTEGRHSVPVHGGGFYDVSTDGEVLSRFDGAPSAFAFENGGVKLLVLCFDAAAADATGSVMISYARAKQIGEFAGFACNEKSHGIYRLCAEGVTLTMNLGEDVCEGLSPGEADLKEL